MKVTIVIPVYNQYELLHELLWNLYRKERENIDTIVIVDDCSTEPEVKSGLQWWKNSDMLPLVAIQTPSNSGFLSASNYGIHYAISRVPHPDESRGQKTDLIVLLSTDVKVYGKFITQVMDAMKSNPKSLVGGILYTHDTGWNTFDGKIFPYLEGWLLATSENNWHQLGYFDPLFCPSDFEDVDLSTQALSMGYELVPLNNVGLQHLGGRSIGYSPEREERTRINQTKFREKWLGDKK